MRFHSLLLSSAALVASATVGLAADLPSKKAAPVDYVKVCTIGAWTGFVIPGSDVCLKISGFARYEYNTTSVDHAFFVTGGGAVGHGSGFNDVGANAFTRGSANTIGGQSVLGSVTFDARTTTEYGLLRGRFELRSNGTPDNAYVQFGPWTFGRLQSFFDFYADGYNNLGSFGSDSKATVVAYSANLGGGIFLTASLEDRGTSGFAAPTVGAPGLLAAAATAGSVGGLTTASYRVPDAVAQLLYDPGANGWGSAALSAAVHQVRYTFAPSGAAPGKVDGTYGWAIQGGVKVNLPMLGAGDSATLQAAYSEGALTYVGLGSYTSNNATQTIIGQSDAIAVGPSGSIKLTKAFNVLAGIDHFWTPSFDTALFASYTSVNYASGFLTGAGTLTARDFNLWQAGTQANWVITKGLKVQATGLWYRIDADTKTTDFVAVGGANVKGVDTTSDGFSARLRVQRDF